MPANILNLPCYKVLGIQENEHDYHIDVETLEAPTSCPHCQSGSLVGFGRREQMVKDLPMHGRRVGLYIDTRRYQCLGCGKTFYEALPEIDEKRLMTKRLAQWMGKQSIKRTFASIAEEVGCTEFTVRAVFADYVAELERQFRFEALSARMFPTLTARDYRSEKRSPEGLKKRATQGRNHTLPASLEHELSGQGGPLNPDWCEWFMGFPIGWTASAPLEMHKYQEWRQQHGRR